MALVKCKNCGDEGHVAWNCSKPRRVVVEAATKSAKPETIIETKSIPSPWDDGLGSIWQPPDETIIETIISVPSRRRGRPRKYASNAERLRACRRRKKLKAFRAGLSTLPGGEVAG
jgi:hypothetical protein